MLKLLKLRAQGLFLAFLLCGLVQKCAAAAAGDSSHVQEYAAADFQPNFPTLAQLAADSLNPIECLQDQNSMQDTRVYARTFFKQNPDVVQEIFRAFKQFEVCHLGTENAVAPVMCTWLHGVTRGWWKTESATQKKFLSQILSEELDLQLLDYKRPQSKRIINRVIDLHPAFFLIDLGAEINSQGSRGYTALDLAIIDYNLHAIEPLIRLGASSTGPLTQLLLKSNDEGEMMRDRIKKTLTSLATTSAH